MGAAANDQFVYVASLDNLLRALAPWERQSDLETQSLDSNDSPTVDLRWHCARHWERAHACDVRCRQPERRSPPFLWPPISRECRWSITTPEPFRVAIVVVTRDGSRHRASTDRHDVSRASSHPDSNASRQTAQPRASSLPTPNLQLPTPNASPIPNVEVTSGFEIGVEVGSWEFIESFRETTSAFLDALR